MQINWKQTLPFGFGIASIFLIWPLFNQFVPLFLQAGDPSLWDEELTASGRAIPTIAGFGLSPALAFFVMTWDNLLNLFVQPWAGIKSDGTWTRFGRRKPWIMVGVPIALFGFTLIPFATTLWAILLFIFVMNVGMALFRAPTAAWLGDLFSTEQQSRARGVAAAMGGAAALLVLVVGSILFERIGRAAPFILAAVLMSAASTIALLFVREPHPEETEALTARGEMPGEGALTHLRTALRRLWKTENRGGIWLLLGILLSFMMLESLVTGISSFALFELGVTAGEAVRFGALFALALALSAVPSGILGSRFGPLRAMRVGLLGTCVAVSIGSFFIRSPLGLALMLIPLGFLASLVIINDLPLLLRLTDDRQIGANTGLYFVATQSAAVVGPALMGLTVEVGDSYRLLFAFAAFCALCAWGLLQQVRGDG